jgi:hypothetical protein
MLFDIKKHYRHKPAGMMMFNSLGMAMSSGLATLALGPPDSGWIEIYLHMVALETSACLRLVQYQSHDPT